MIIFSHLLNDRSGSPKVLAEVIDCIREMDLESCLFLGSQGQGILDESGIPIARYWYRRGSHRLITMLYFFFSQLCLFLRLLRTPNLPTDAIVYVNTLLPFGAALYGALTGRNVIYHLHEVSVTPAPLRWLLTGIAHLTAKRLIYVSNFHHSRLPIVGVPATIIYNVVDMGIAKHAKLAPPFHPRRIGNFNVLMLSSLRGL